MVLSPHRKTFNPGHHLPLVHQPCQPCNISVQNQITNQINVQQVSINLLKGITSFSGGRVFMAMMMLTRDMLLYPDSEPIQNVQ